MFDAFCPHTIDFCQIFLTPGDTFKHPLYIYLHKSSVHWRCSDPFFWSCQPNLSKFRSRFRNLPMALLEYFTVSLSFFFILVNCTHFVRLAEPERPEGGRELCQRGDQPSIRGALTQGANQGE